MRQPSAIVGKQPRRAAGAGDDSLEFARCRLASQPGDHERQDVEVERIAVVVRRALRVTPVQAELPIDPGEEHLTSEPFPATAGRELRQRPARDVERETFAEQVSVGAEVVRQVAFDLPQLSVDAEQQIDDPGLLDPVVAGDEKIQRPQPRQNPQRQLQHAGPVDPDERRIGGQPTGKLLLEPITVTRVARQPAGTPQHEPRQPLALRDGRLRDDLHARREHRA